MSAGLFFADNLQEGNCRVGADGGILPLFIFFLS